ncbi:FHA domain-containing protein [Crocinitomicaceae bacterium]|jgi:pSer/pThr/pTyr-binding forkhead associated (FHA) protein|nr:FHA domain-containing protein [Crocinitomicaceae bacterium]
MANLLLKIGKASDNDIVINNSFISDYHIELFVDENNAIFLTDLKSNNGTFVNGKRLKGFIRLQSKDEVFIGNGYFFDWEKILYDMQKKNKKSLDIKKKVKNKSEVKQSFIRKHVDLVVIYSLVFIMLIYLSIIL